MAIRPDDKETPLTTGEWLLAEDGSTWRLIPRGEDHEAQGSDATIEQGEDAGPSASLMDELESRKRQLATDHRVWMAAFGLCATIKVHGPDLRDTDPLETFVELLARAAMEDAIALVCDGARLGLEQHLELKLRAFLGDPEMGTIKNKLAELRLKDADEQQPAAMIRAAGEHLRVLGDIANTLAMDSDARNTLTRIVSTQETDVALADKLFRQVLEQGKPVEMAWAAQRAAEAVLRARATTH